MSSPTAPPTPSSPATAIEVQSVSKRYLLGEERYVGRDLRDAFASGLRRLRQGVSTRDEIWSLRDVSFEVERGQALGVIGRNGAGKSTLLKVLTRITEPTSGVSRTRGRVGSLLEVGTGFHPDLTGRENVYLNGAILGMPRRTIDDRLDQIVDFAGVARFLDTPVKRYSSGMYLRLAFSVAAHLDADVLLVDEVLAVGDAEFQRRCLTRMAEVERDGRTVVFVSHNLDAIVRLCPETIWLDQGRIVAQGPSADVVDQYLTAGLDRSSRLEFPADPASAVALRAVEVTGGDGGDPSSIRRDRPFTIRVELDVRERINGLNAAISLMTRRGTRVFDEALADHRPDAIGDPGRYTLALPVPPVLAGGEYVVSVWVGNDYEAFVWLEDALALHVESTTVRRTERLLQLDLPWEVHVDEDQATDV